MGNVSSVSSRSKHVFQQELIDLKKIVNTMILPGQEGDYKKSVFLQNRHSFLTKDVCDNYAVMFSDRLQKYSKVDLQNLSSSLYLIPHTKGSKKIEICDKIAEHYTKILYILSLIFYIYDLENDGDLSIAGIVFRNIRVIDDLMEINYCESPQRAEQFSSKNKDVLDFSRLKGLEFFVKHMLEKNESCAFLSVFKDVLGRKNTQKIIGTIKKHDFDHTTIKDLEILFGTKLCQSSHSPKSTKSSVSLNVHVAKNNPLLAADLCYSPKKIIVKLNTKEGKILENVYKSFITHYEKNVKNILSCVQKLVTSDSVPDIRPVTSSELENIKNDVCRYIKVFFIQSVIDYQRILDTAKTLPNFYDEYIDNEVKLSLK